MTTNRKRHSKSKFVLFQNFIDLIHYHLICQQCSRYFLGLNPKGPYLSLEKEKENFCVVFTYSFKPVREIRRFHVAVVQRRLRNVQKSVMHVQSCCFVTINLLLFFAFSSPSLSSLIKLRTVVIQKFCHHGSVTPHFSRLLVVGK